MPQPTADPPVPPLAMTPERLDGLEQIAKEAVSYQKRLGVEYYSVGEQLKEAIVEIRRARAEIKDIKAAGEKLCTALELLRKSL